MSCSPNNCPDCIANSGHGLGLCPHHDVERLRAIEAAARAVLEYEWGDPRKGLRVPENQPAWKRLEDFLTKGQAP